MHLETKSFAFADMAVDADEKPGRFTGKAAVYGNVDSYRDVIVPGACTESIAEKAGEIVVLCQHDSHNSIGMAVLSDSPSALLCDGQLELELMAARETYVRMQRKMLTGISIGYETLEETYEGKVRYLKKIRLHEISLVTFPANTRARVTGVKALGENIVGEIIGWERELKEGRMLSASTMKLVTECREYALSVADQLAKLIEAATSPAPKDDGTVLETAEGVSPEAKAEQEALLSEMTDLRHALSAIKFNE